jgi:hypothetical protein
MVDTREAEIILQAHGGAGNIFHVHDTDGYSYILLVKIHHKTGVHLIAMSGL